MRLRVSPLQLQRPLLTSLRDLSIINPSIPTCTDTQDDLCDLQDAIRMYPANQATLNETGIPADLQVTREQATTHAGASVYLCRHKKCGDVPFHAQSPAGLYSHVRRKHLGICLACPYCANKLYWNSRGWSIHMRDHHANVPRFGSALVDEAREAQKMLDQAQEDPSALSQ